MASRSDKHSDVEELQLALAHARHENIILKTELLYTIQQNHREVKELKLIQQSKINELEQAIKNLEKKGSSYQDQNSQEQKHLQQLNLQLNQKLKLCENELDATKKDHDKSCDLNQNQLAQLKFITKEKDEELQTAKESNMQLKEKVCSLEVDLDKERTRSHELEITLSSEKHQMKMIKSRVEEVEQQYQVQLSAAKAEVEKYKTQIRCLEDSFQKRVEELKESLELEKNSHQEANEKVANAEREAKRKRSELKQLHLSETQNLLQENSKLMKKIQTLQQIQSGVNFPVEGDKVEEISKELQLKTEELNAMRRERLVLQSKVEECQELKDDITKEKQMTRNLHEEITEIVSQMKKTQKENSDLQTINKSLNESLAENEKVLKDLMQDVRKERSIHHQMLTDAKLNGEEQVAENLCRISALEGQLLKKSQDYLKESQLLKEKVKQYGGLIKKLRFRLEKAGIKEKELEAKQEALQRDFVPSHQYRQLQQQLQQIINKHSEFKAFIQGLGKNQENLNQIEDLNHRVTSISDKLFELESAQNEAYNALEAL